MGSPTPRAPAWSGPCWSGPRWPGPWRGGGGCGRFRVHHMEAHLLAPMLETPAPEFPFLALPGVGGPYPASGGQRSGALPGAGRVPGRRRRGGLRQDRQAARPRLSRRAAPGAAGTVRACRALPFPAPHDGLARPRFQLQRAQDPHPHDPPPGEPRSGHPRRHRARLPGGRRRYPVYQMPPRLARDGAQAARGRGRGERQPRVAGPALVGSPRNWA